MFSQHRRVAILAFLITPFLMLGHANGFTELPALTATVTESAPAAEKAAAATTTTATVASSNAPATITNDAALKLETETTTTMPTTSSTTTTKSTSITGKQRDEVQFATMAAESLSNSDVPPQRSASKSFSGNNNNNENDDDDNDMHRTENVENAGKGNAVKITQIKYAEKQLAMVATTAATSTTRAATTEQATPTTTTSTDYDALSAFSKTRQQKEAPALVENTNEANSHQSTTIANRLVTTNAADAAGNSQEDNSTETESSMKYPHKRCVKRKKFKVSAPVANDADETIASTTQPDTFGTMLVPGKKINILDLYPIEIEDYHPIITISNKKLLKVHTIYVNQNDTQYRQNLLPNELEVNQYDDNVHGMENVAQLPAKHTVNHPAVAVPTTAKTEKQHSDAISDFTGKLLAEQDGVITEIERKFRVYSNVATDASSTSTSSSTSIEATTSNVEMATSTNTPTIDAVKPRRVTYSVNHKTPAGHDFIDRRVKKSFDFPMHRAASDAIALPHVDFANTKFNTDNNAPKGSGSSIVQSEGDSKSTSAVTHPEFSTTKFYNSKELYSQLLQLHKDKLRQMKEKQIASISGKTSRPIAVNQLTTAAPITVKLTTFASPATTATTMPTGATSVQVDATIMSPPKKFQKELKRAKLLLKTLLPILTTTKSTTTTMSMVQPVATAASIIDAATSTKVADTSIATAFATTKDLSMPAATTTTTSRTTTKALHTVQTTLAATASTDTFAETDSMSSALAASGTVTTNAPAPSSTFAILAVRHRTTNPTKSSSKPIVRPRILSRLQEKINSLECEVPSVPQDSHLWRGNETHELMLPIVAPDCPPSSVNCLSQHISWEGEAEIQSGDILIVEINDALLTAHFKNKTNSAHTTQVYQVTRSGHEHCDVTEGILLDITPLVVDGRKLVTLYDKDLTEGVNLLIVVSELWGSQCIRLKVTTKTDNCGENADCSGKGVCFSNPSMEEYECQCCSGFAGPHCEEIDACTPSPCTNNGICVDLSQGHEGNSYQCLCPYGYTGKNCQYEADPCNPTDCMNGGSCVGNSTHFRCDCTPGFTGPLCQHSLNECESSPCMHGICVDQEDGFRCFCQPGFAGELCNFEYNECESSPCQNAGECIDHIGSYECRCTKGYTGSRCQIKVDLCANRPCPTGHRCIDHGNDFSCECPGGQNGPDCNQMTRTQCNVNPCTHGGTCWSSGDSFYCACRPGYTGKMCEDEFVVETVISSSEFMVDDTSARNFNEKTFGTPVVLKSPIELHNAYFAAGVLAAAIFIVAIVVTICHCKVNQTYRKFSTRSTTFFPILGFGRRPKSQNKLNKHWLSGKGLSGSGNPLRASSTRGGSGGGHLPATNGNQYTTTGSTALQQQQQQHVGLAGQLHERPFQRHLAMNLENDMYYTVDYSETSQQSPLIQ